MKMRLSAVILILLVGVSLLAGCGARQTEQPNKAYAATPEDTITLTLYFGNAQADALVKETRVVGRSNQALELVVLNELIKGPQSPEGRISVPQEAKILSVKVENKIAYVDFSREVVEKHWGGSAGDAMTIGSIVHSLTELPGVDKVQLLLEGSIEHAMFGHIATDQPIGQ